jgi:G6PDH family F420-dependent oxidoreductase
MTAYGYTLFCEGNDPRDLVQAGIDAEAAGFDDLVISDHFHPWLPEHSHSPFAWSILGALAHATDRARLATMVTCPIVRYHPAIVAQMAATIGVMSEGRFTLGLGAGERLNEHVVGRGWPSVEVRHEMLDDPARPRSSWPSRPAACAPPTRSPTSSRRSPRPAARPATPGRRSRCRGTRARSRP